ncbi:MAG: SCO family protein [Ktedonobacteraceae bacterium]|nr:SCO family protein [Ktedonobacteraceae bacterium]
MNWRLASRLSVIVFAILVVVFVTIIQHNQIEHVSLPGNTINTEGLQGTDLGATPAPNFLLTDQFGKQVSLSQFKGQPVVLTFLYTHCPDVCPLTAEKLHTVMQNLGSDAQRVAVLAVSTDPKRDNISAALSFSKTHRMTEYWHFLVGTQASLSPVWTAYSVYAQQEQQTVNHTLALFVIDKQGKERILLDDSFTPTQLTDNLRILLKE